MTIAPCRDVACRVSTTTVPQYLLTITVLYCRTMKINTKIKIMENETFLNKYRIKSARAIWTNHCLYVEFPLFVVMPNHWHAIVFIDGDKTPYIRRQRPCNDECPHVETRHATSLQPQPKNEQMQNIANKQGWLSVAIGGIKSAVTKFAHDNDMDFVWQTRFHDHIIRNPNEMNRIADYIENNPITWESDCFNENNNATMNCPT